MVDRETREHHREHRSGEELQVGAASEEVQEASGNSRDSMDDAEHNFESVGARPLNAATELLSTPSTRAVLDRDDAAAPWAEPPLTEIHMPESCGAR